MVPAASGSPGAAVSVVLGLFVPGVVAAGLGRGGAAATSRSASSLSADTAAKAAPPSSSATNAVIATGTFQLGGRR